MFSEAISTTTEVKWKNGRNMIDVSMSLLDPDENEIISGLRTFFYWLTDNMDPANDDVAEVEVYREKC